MLPIRGASASYLRAILAARTACCGVVPATRPAPAAALAPTWRNERFERSSLEVIGLSPRVSLPPRPTSWYKMLRSPFSLLSASGRHVPPRRPPSFSIPLRPHHPASSPSNAMNCRHDEELSAFRLRCRHRRPTSGIGREQGPTLHSHGSRIRRNGTHEENLHEGK